jgi:hypothetical protein
VSSPTSASDNEFVIWQHGYSNKIQVYLAGTSIAAPWTPSTNRWYHIEVNRQGPAVRVFIDGVQVTTGTSSADLNFNQLHVGKYGSDSAYMLDGYIDELRISKGIARHVSDFTPPISEY